MAGLIRDDPYGLNDTIPADVGVTTPTSGDELLTRGLRPDSLLERAPVNTSIDVPAATTAATPAASVAPPVPNGLNTLYGVDSESYLTDDQRKLARSIQGQFDASANRRDRELARYGAPRLSSFAEDESLARAMALARGLNTPADQPIIDPTTGLIRNAPGGGGGGGAYPRLPTYPDLPTPYSPTGPTGAQTNAQWQRILSGLASIAPLLFGKDAYGNFLNKGLIGTIKDKLFGSSAPYVTDQSLENMVSSGALPGYGNAAGGYSVNPFTGQPMSMYGGTTVDTSSAPWGASAEGGAPYPTASWGDTYGSDTGGDWSDWIDWGNGGSSFGNWSPDTLDLFGGV